MTMRNAIRALFIVGLLAGFAGYLTSCSPEDPGTPTQVVVDQPVTGTKAVTLQISSAEIPADGVSSVQLTAVCTVDGQEAPNGLPVTFRTNAGDLSLNGVEPIDNNDVTRQTTITTGAGRATVFLISDLEPGLADIRVVFGNDATAAGSVEFIRTVDEVDTVTMTVSPSTGQAPLTAELKATVNDADGNGLSGVLVRFRATDDKATFDRKKVKTDSQGVAATFIRNVSQDTTVKATASGVQAQELINITNDQVNAVELEVVNTAGGLAGQNPVLISANGQLLLVATVTGTSGPVSNTAVTFLSSDPNTNFNPANANTNSSGEARSTASNIKQDSTITARASGVTDTLSVKINRSPVAVVRQLTGDPVAGVVGTFTFSAEDSFDPDTAFGDSIVSYTWAFEMQSSASVTITESNTGNPQLRTFQVGEFGVNAPASGDVFTVFVTVVDSFGRQSTARVSLTFV